VDECKPLTLGRSELAAVGKAGGDLAGMLLQGGGVLGRGLHSLTLDLNLRTFRIRRSR